MGGKEEEGGAKGSTGAAAAAGAPPSRPPSLGAAAHAARQEEPPQPARNEECKPRHVHACTLQAMRAGSEREERVQQHSGAVLQQCPRSQCCSTAQASSARSSPGRPCSADAGQWGIAGARIRLIGGLSVSEGGWGLQASTGEHAMQANRASRAAASKHPKQARHPSRDRSRPSPSLTGRARQHAC